MAVLGCRSLVLVINNNITNKASELEGCLNFLKGVPYTPLGVTGKARMPEQPGQHYFCELYHVLSFWLFTIQQFTLTDYICGLLLRVLSRNRAINFFAEGIDIYSTHKLLE